MHNFITSNVTNLIGFGNKTKSLLKKKKIEIHIRSIFLQGLLLINENKIPKKFLKWHLLFKNWHTWTKDKKISSLKACINYVFSFKEIDKIIIGVNNLKQIKQIFEAVNNHNGVYPKNIFSNGLKSLYMESVPTLGLI